MRVDGRAASGQETGPNARGYRGVHASAARARCVSRVDTLGYLNAQGDDDRAFLVAAARLLAAIEGSFEMLIVIRVRDWFDHKWLRFSGNGLVPFGHCQRSQPGIALESFHQEKLTFPPFSPHRIVVEEHFADFDIPDPPAIHSRRRRRSARNLHRRVENYAQSLLAVWISTASELTGRASFMAYSRAPESAPDAWYVSFRRYPTDWRVDRVKGVDRERILSWLGEEAPTSAAFMRS
jgi:hypothetical protein